MKRFYLFRPHRLAAGLWLLGSLFWVSSCTVTNSLYVNNAMPLPKGDSEIFGGLGMGLKPAVDSVSVSGEVFSSNFKRSYNLVFGGREGLTDHFSLGGSIHFPKILGGFGGHIRPQISLLPPKSDFNLALAVDLGGIISKDSLRLLGSASDLENDTRGAIFADFALPVTQKLFKDTWLILTPRYSYNAFYLREKWDQKKSKKRKLEYPALSIGLRHQRLHLEASVISYNHKQHLVFGLAFFISQQKASPATP